MKYMCFGQGGAMVRLLWVQGPQFLSHKHEGSLLLHLDQGHDIKW